MTLVFPLPPKALHPNARVHWRAKAAMTASCRNTAAIIARSDWSGPVLERCVIQTTYYLPRKMDTDNLLSWGKSLYDGLQGVVYRSDAGVVHLPVVQHTGKGIDYRVELEITAKE